MLEIALLGPPRVRVGGVEVRLRSAAQRRLLGVLVLAAGNTVQSDHLFSAVWPDADLTDPRAALHTTVRRLRRNLGDAGPLLVTERNGYRLAIDAAACDVHRFRQLVRSAGSTAPDPAAAIDSALALWRVEPGDDALPDLPGPSAAALVEERIDAVGRRIDLDLAAGRHRRVVAELSGLTASWPLHERFWAQLITALTRCGRQADALTAFQDVRRRLIEELGVEPGQELRRAHVAALTGEGAERDVDGSADDGKPSSAWTTQHQLPLDVAELIGREEESATIQDLLVGPGCPLVVVTGLPGVGKSALAVRAAHEVREHFPDGQLYLTLGAGRRRSRSPGQLLDLVLAATGHDARRSPPDLDARAATLRSRLAGRRVLLVLDDAADAEQVSTLLPGTEHCAVLVTSRNRLPELTALYGARPVPLDPLPAADALDLLRTALGPQRFDVDDPHLRSVVELCGRLPLALRIASAAFAHDPGLSTQEYRDRLQADGVGELTIPGSSVGMAETFDSWLDALDPPLRQAFSLCAASPTVDLPQDAIAALFGLPAAETGRLLERLCGANLLTRTGRQRFVIHDLLRDHAAGRGDRDAPDAHGPAIDRMALWCLDRLDEMIAAVGDATFGAPQRTRTTGPQFADARAAMAWAETELPNLVGIAVHYAQSANPQFAWQLTAAARPLLNRGNNLAEWRVLLDAALPAAERSGDDQARAAMYNSAGSWAAHAGDLGQARQHYRTAVELYERHANAAGAAIVLNNLGEIESEIGSLPIALDYYDRSVEVARQLGQDRLLAAVLANRSDTELRLGRVGPAISDTDEALHLAPAGVLVVARTNRGTALAMCGRYAEAHADTAAAMDAWAEATMGSVTGSIGPSAEFADRCLDLGDVESATQLAQRALDWARDSDDGFRTVDALVVAATAARAAGDADRAISLATEAVELAGGIGGHRTVATRTCLAQALQAAGRTDPAAEAGRIAEREAGTASMPIEQCRAILVLAAVARRRGDTSAAAEWDARIATIEQRTGYVPRPSDRMDRDRPGRDQVPSERLS